MQLDGLRIATVYGTRIRIHLSFLLVLPLVAYGFGRAFITAADLADVPSSRLVGTPWLWGLGVAVALFASVLVHELAHSIYAVWKGGRVRSITLLMVGGVSEITEPPRRMRDEAVMALVGPLASLGLASVLFVLYAGAERASFNLRFALFYVGSLNVLLGAFNLLPAFPMDGGRILRALLTSRMGLVRATHVAARVGKVFAAVFAVWGFLTFNMLLLLIAFLVFIGGEAETRAVMVKALLGRLRVRDVMSYDLASVPADVIAHESVATSGALSPAQDAARALRLMSETDVPRIPVVEHGLVIGVVSRDDIVRSLKLAELESRRRPGTRPWMRRRGEAPA